MTATMNTVGEIHSAFDEHRERIRSMVKAAGKGDDRVADAGLPDVLRIALQRQPEGRLLNWLLDIAWVVGKLHGPEGPLWRSFDVSIKI